MCGCAGGGEPSCSAIGCASGLLAPLGTNGRKPTSSPARNCELRRRCRPPLDVVPREPGDAEGRTRCGWRLHHRNYDDVNGCQKELVISANRRPRTAGSRSACPCTTAHTTRPLARSRALIPLPRANRPRALERRQLALWIKSGHPCVFGHFPVDSNRDLGTKQGLSPSALGTPRWSLSTPASARRARA